MKQVIISLLAMVVLTSCVNIKIASVDPITHATNQFSGNFFFATTAAKQVDVMRQTKTTSSMLSAKNVSETGDVESINAFFNGVQGITASAVSAGVKAAKTP